MSIIILIHELDKDGQRVKTYTYGKSDQTALEKINEFEKLVDSPQVYVTGLGGWATQKRLEKILPKFGSFETERVQYEGRQGLTANSNIRNGAVPPQKVRGG